MEIVEIPQKPLHFMLERQLVLAPLDILGRARDAHIQLRDAFEPLVERKHLDYHPPGYQHIFLKNKMSNGKSYNDYLWTRGHLVGHQFSGLDNEPRNLVTQTVWCNSGSYFETDESNVDSMIFYESRLDKWINTFPELYLDYQVTPIYHGNELVPREIRLAYVAYSPKSQILPLILGSNREKLNEEGVTIVIIPNSSPNAVINYETGFAKQK
ncbi:DNA/RNA non-specific endonuclease [Lactovum miscens]|uniref:DNA-entry nuclease n=1 Tax=Lactovum miscens TaxID=190387 RepID=A0A841CAI4_9LACT|nr:DNA/RNA non-specific endonuclease [Lactovum miscens]MBB5888571.1 DNA-entry nuclease [Lactovum miscens]